MYSDSSIIIPPRKAWQKLLKHCKFKTAPIQEAYRSKSNHWLNVISTKVKSYLPVLKYSIAAFCSLWWQLMYDIGCLLPILAWNCHCAVWQTLSCGLMMHTNIFLHTIFCTGEELPFIFLLCSLQQQVSIEKVQELNCTKIGYSEASNKQLFIQHLFSFINVTLNHSGQFTQYERDLGVL